MGRQAHRRRKFRELTTAQGKRVWSSELADDARVRRRERGERRRAGGESAGGEGELARRRGEIAERVRAGELDEAARAYRELLGAHGEQVVGRDAQLAIANHLGDRGEASEAATAYRLFVERFPKDREADRVRLLLALLNARSLNDPIAASELLERIDRSGLSDEERSVLDALQGEVS
jgi:predicted Zn-dependent protease